ncbi:LysR family transcriptional regulator [Symbioplanes lichenis]|uniref:LysR family transcriptional regulator n=1 Tax=Symbioplanes lichenis TaxID=1629072 RepID=UPI0027398687|nr:LysR substrate-binding domain-containing protein [Actinoplanes lichenis]
MADLDLRRLRYFVTLAGTLNYGRAAEALHLAQPALSRAITALERELGVTLFDRSRSGTRLTAAGERLLREAPGLLRAAETLQRRVREGQTLTIGFLPGSILTPVVRHLERRFPGLRVDMLRTSWTDQLTGLRDGRFDACLAQRPFDDDGLTVVDLYAEPRAVALPVGHPYAGKGEVSLADLAGDALAQPAAAVPGWPGPVTLPASCAVTPTVEEKFEQVAAGRGVVVIAESATRYYRRPDVTFARVRDLPPAQVCLVTDARRRSPVLRELMAAGPGLLRAAHADAASTDA